MKVLSFFAILLFASVFIVGDAFPLTLSLDQTDPYVYPGETTSLSLNISGLNDGGPDSLGAFDLYVTYDESIMNLSSVDFGPYLGSFLETDMFVNPDPGRVRLQEISWLLDWELDALQPDSFTIATMGFTGMRPGKSHMDMEDVVLSDSLGYQLPRPVINGTVVKIIPEPSTIFLFVYGFFFYRRLRRMLKGDKA